MRSSLNRLSRPHLRPRLKASKITYDKIHPVEKGQDPDPVENKAQIAGASAADSRLHLPAGNRFAHAQRPAVRDILTAYGTASAGSQEEPVIETAGSSIQRWGMLLVILIVLVWTAGLLIGFQASLSILLSIGLVLCVAGLVSPGLGVLAIGMVAALDAMANIFLFTGGVLRYNTLNYWLLLVVVIFIPFILRLNDLNSRTLQIFVALMALELTFSSDISSGVQDILNIGVTFGMVVYFARALKDELSLYWLGIVNGVLAGLGGLIFYLQMGKLPYANPNDWTYFQLTALFSICIAYQFAIKYHKNRLVLLLLATLNFAWVFLSGSRGSLLIAMLSLVYLFLTTRSLTWKTVMIAVVAMAGIWVSLNFAEQQVTTIGRLQLLFDTSQSTAKRTSERSVIAQAGLQIFKNHPMGIGTGSFAQESINTGLLASQRPAHSAWIQVLAENGVLGAILLAAFVLSFAIVGIRKRQEGQVLFAIFITLVFAGAFVAKEFRGKSLWFLAASGIVLLHPQVILAQINQSVKPHLNKMSQLRKVRFARKR